MESEPSVYAIMKRKRGEFGAVFAAVLLRRTDAMRVSRDPREKSGKSGRNLKIRKSKRRLCRPESVQNYKSLQLQQRCKKSCRENLQSYKNRVTDPQLALPRTT